MRVLLREPPVPVSLAPLPDRSQRTGIAALGRDLANDCWSASLFDPLESMESTRCHADRRPMCAPNNILAFTSCQQQAGIPISVDVRGRFMDKIPIERLWCSLKYEGLYLHEIADGLTAIHLGADYEQVYN